jgi:hypothetical protein
LSEPSFLSYWNVVIVVFYTRLATERMPYKLKELTNSDIEEMRKLHNAGKRHSWIAHKYGVRKKDLAEILFRELR